MGWVALLPAEAKSLHASIKASNASRSSVRSALENPFQRLISSSKAMRYDSTVLPMD
jgi:hypothetical protein